MESRKKEKNNVNNKNNVSNKDNTLNAYQQVEQNQINEVTQKFNMMNNKNKLESNDNAEQKQNSNDNTEQKQNSNEFAEQNLKSNENTDENQDNSQNTDSTETNENIKEMGTISDVNPSKEICFLSIIGEIEGHNILPPNSKATKYEHIIPQIIGAEMDKEVKGIMLLINTVGGDVEAGLAISELICSISKPTVSIVLGGGHSIGNALAVSTKYSFITPTGTMTIHPIRTNGFVIGVVQTFRYFQKMQERITNFIVDNSSVDREELLKYMYDTDEIANDVGTVLNSKEIIKMGLINEIGGFKEALAKLREMISEANQ
jgi:ATP-dependent protease ClpP protease subunit